MGDLIGSIFGAILSFGACFFVVAVCVGITSDGGFPEQSGACAIAAAILYLAWRYEEAEAAKFKLASQENEKS